MAGADQLAMADDGAHGDGGRRDGVYASLVGLSASSVIAYRFQVTDTDANVITALNATPASFVQGRSQEQSILWVLDRA
jgi:hypothetical protein